jgi:hypothetical protein|tara:strand:+ start:2008 stop:2241 length:234 start_codon:yes stop_codon:yes gene_type:complete
MSKLFLKVFGQELFNVFVVELVMFVALAVIFLIVSLVLMAVSWLWKIGIIIAMLVGIKIAHVRTKNRFETTPVILYD